MSTRRSAFGVIAGAIAGFMGKPTLAQQTVGNELRITATGNVYVGQRAAGTQEVYADAQGHRYYVRDPAQVVVNNGQIVATGDVWVEQEAAAQQEITLATQQITEEVCIPGQVKVHHTGTEHPLLLYQDERCAWQYLAPVPVILPTCQFVVQCAH